MHILNIKKILNQILTQFTGSKRDIAVAKCAGCGHLLNDHYHIKSEGYGCIGDKCNCPTFLIK
jgi:hypothetical protein